MKKIKRVSWLFAAMALTVLTAGVSVAQVTSSAIQGTVKDAEGNPVAGAEVVIVHQPTGSTKTTTTSEEGRFYARGLRVGGPYEVTISKDGYVAAKEENLSLKLGEVRTIDAVVVPSSYKLDTVQVVGVATSDTFSADNMGAGSTVTREQMDNLPSINRSLADFVRLDPRVSVDDRGGISVAGTNNRYNNIAIDGVPTNDEFGLEAGGLPGTRQPYSLDSIEQLSVQVSPYDVALGNFTGANINAVTKSGTNEFSGRVSAYYRNEDMIRSGVTDQFTDRTWSVNVGGPIIKDKLFYFISYEDQKETEVAFDSFVPDSDMQAIADISQNVYGFDPGSYTAPSELEATSKKLLAKIDWTINDAHRLSVRYNKSEDVDVRLANNGGSRRSFSSHWYDNNFDFDNTSAILYSDWTPNFSTEIRVSQSEMHKYPKVNSRLPHVEIDTDNGTVYLGRERFRHANDLLVDTTSVFAAGEYFMGQHTIKFGLDYKNKDTHNVFVESSLGRYEFDSIEDYAAGNYSRYVFRIGRDPNNPYPAADWEYAMTGLFVQDNWMVNDRLTVTYGVRYDTPDVKDTPAYNPDFEAAFGFPNNAVIDSGVVQPRIGFNYDMSDDLYLQLRGGVGVFMGSTPDVWLSNSFTNTGIAIAEYFDRSGEFGFNPDPDNQPRPGSGTGGRMGVDALDPDFQFPTKLRANLALDGELPWYGLIAGAEFIYTRNIEEIMYQHLNLGAPTGTLPDGRYSYYEDPADPNRRETRANANPAFGDVLFLTNTGKGETKSLTLSLEKPMGEHFSAKVAYTYTDATDVNSGVSSRAISGWRNRPSVNPNDEELSTSNYEVENRFVGWLNYENNFFGDTITRFSLVYTREDGRPFSYIFDNDANGDAVSYNDLFYVPNAGEYVLTDPSQQAAFEQFLADSGLDAYRGGVAPRNAFKQPTRHRWDLRISQELPQMGPGRATLFFDIENIGNLLDKDWGEVRFVSFGTADVANYEGLDDQGRWILDWNGRTDHTRVDRLRSSWRGQIGFRYDW